MTDIDLVAIARLRGTALRNFHFPALCIDRSTHFNLEPLSSSSASNSAIALNDYISLALGYAWSPTAEHLIPELQQVAYEPQMTYQQTLLEI